MIQIIATKNSESEYSRLYSGRGDTSQQGNWFNFRNEKYSINNLTTEITIDKDFLKNLPVTGTLEFDYVSTTRPNIHDFEIEEDVTEDNDTDHELADHLHRYQMKNHHGSNKSAGSGAGSSGHHSGRKKDENDHDHHEEGDGRSMIVSSTVKPFQQQKAHLDDHNLRSDAMHTAAEAAVDAVEAGQQSAPVKVGSAGGGDNDSVVSSHPPPVTPLPPPKASNSDMEAVIAQYSGSNSRRNSRSNIGRPPSGKSRPTSSGGNNNDSNNNGGSGANSRPISGSNNKERGSANSENRGSSRPKSGSRGGSSRSKPGSPSRRSPSNHSSMNPLNKKLHRVANDDNFYTFMQQLGLSNRAKVSSAHAIFILMDLQLAATKYYFKTSQIVQILDAFEDKWDIQSRVVVAMFSRIKDIHNMDIVLRNVHTKAQKDIVKRLGYFNVMNPLKVAFDYHFSLKYLDNRIYMIDLLTLDSIESGGNIMEDPTTELPKDALYGAYTRALNETRPETMKFTYFDFGIRSNNVNWSSRRELMKKFLIGTHPIDEEVYQVVHMFKELEQAGALTTGPIDQQYANYLKSKKSNQHRVAKSAKGMANMLKANANWRKSV